MPQSVRGIDEVLGELHGSDRTLSQVRPAKG